MCTCWCSWVVRREHQNPMTWSDRCFWAPVLGAGKWTPVLCKHREGSQPLCPSLQYPLPILCSLQQSTKSGQSISCESSFQNAPPSKMHSLPKGTTDLYKYANSLSQNPLSMPSLLNGIIYSIKPPRTVQLIYIQNHTQKAPFNVSGKFMSFCGSWVIVWIS